MLGIIIGGFIVTIGIIIGGIALCNNGYDFELLGVFLIVIGILGICFMIAISVDFAGIEGSNRELFLKMQQEYKVINQYIKSDKSDSILESQDMMNRIMEYNETLIRKQNNMTRPILKYWSVGANWYELQLIELEEK